MPIHGLPTLPTPHPPHFDIEKVIRPNILALHPYRCARDDYSEGILLDANENSLGHSIEASQPSSSSAPSETKPLEVGAGDDFTTLDLHRYPDPAQLDIKSRYALLRGLTTSSGSPKHDHVFLGVGSDEVIDLLMRVCVAPGKEKILVAPPTYGMFGVCAQVNDVGVVKVPLDVEGGKFQLRLDAMKQAIDADPSIKLIFLCSPGNPTGTLLSLSSIQSLLEYPKFKGILVIDEAYIDFAPQGSSVVPLVEKYANLCVTQTMSKSFGLAAIRLGIAIAQPPLIQVLSNTKAPYNISTPTSHLALSALSSASLTTLSSKLAFTSNSRVALLQSLSSLSSLGVGASIGGNAANFVMIPILNKETGAPDNTRSERVYKELAEKEGIVVRFRGKEYGCDGCLRITVGTEEENRVLIDKLKDVLARF